VELAYPSYTSFIVVDTAGQLLATDRDGAETNISFTDRSWFSRVTEEKAFASGRFVSGRLSGEPIVPMASPHLGADGEIDAIVATGLKLTWIGDFLAGGLVPDRTTVTFFRPDERILARFPEGEEEDIGASAGGQRLSAELRDSIRRSQGAFVAEGAGGGKTLYSTAPIRFAEDRERLSVLVALPVSAAFEQADRQLARLGTWLLIIAMAGAVALWLSGRHWVLRPLGELRQAAERLAAGAPVERATLNYARGEIGDLQRSFDQMAERIQSRQQRLEQELYWSQLLATLADAIAERQTIDSAFRVTVQQLVTSLGSEAGVMTVRDRSRDVETLRIVQVPDPGLAECLKELQGETLEIATSELLEAFGGSEPLLVRLRRDDPGTVPMPYRRALNLACNSGLYSVLFLPVVAAGAHGHLGTLWLMFSERETISNPEDTFLRHLSSHLSVAIQHSHAYEELERAYNELRTAHEAATQKERLNAMGQMASGIAHDINNSLMPITSYADLLSDSEPGLTDQGRQHLEMIKKAGWSIEAATARMKKFYRSHDDARHTSVDVGEMLDAVIELTRPRWEDMQQHDGREIEVQRYVEAELPQLQAFESEVREALTNLVFNAVDAMPGGGKIRLEAGVKENALVLSVSDTGSGMNDEQKRRALEPLYTSKGNAGTGMGLATAYGVMQRHGGEIEIDSEPDVGTTVYLVFPLDWEQERLEETSPRGEAESYRALRVLCVDDDAAALYALRDMLTAHEHSVEITDDGEEAVRMLERASETGKGFDAIVTDLGMPRMDGRELARRAKELFPRTAVVLVSGGKAQMSEDDIDLVNVDAFLGKPPQLQKLLKTLNDHAGGVSPAESAGRSDDGGG
jgi:signal transduction histidine kinase/ActR/RegA family two-component response regulator